MLCDFPDSIIDYCNPLRLESSKSFLYANPVNNVFDEFNMFHLKCPSVKVKSLFIRANANNSVKKDEVSSNNNV